MLQDEEDLTKLSVGEIKKRFFWAGTTVPAGCVEKAELVAALKKVLAAAPAKAKSGASATSQSRPTPVPQVSPPKSGGGQPKSTAELVAALKKSVGLTGSPAPKIHTPPKASPNANTQVMFKKAAGSTAIPPASVSTKASVAYQSLEHALAGMGKTVPAPAKGSNATPPNFMNSYEKSGGITIAPPGKRSSAVLPESISSVEKAGGITIPPPAKGNSVILLPESMNSGDRAGAITIPPPAKVSAIVLPESTSSAEKVAGITIPPPAKAASKTHDSISEVVSDTLDFDAMMEITPARSGPPVREEVLKKSGKELFRELLRIYSMAVVDDYCRDGIWKDDLMRDDYVLLEAHRKAAGAISPPDLEDVIVPEPNAMPTGIVAPWANGAATIVGPTTEYEFMLKWRLDPARTKAALASLSQQRRNYVYLRFKAASMDLDTNMQLSNYLHACQMSGSWDKAGNIMPAPQSSGVEGVIGPPKSSSTSMSVASPAATPMGITQIVTPIASQIGATSVGAKRPPAPPSDPDLDCSKKQRIENDDTASTRLQPSLALRLAASMSDVGPLVGKASRVARPPILGKRCNPASKAQAPQ